MAESKEPMERAEAHSKSSKQWGKERARSGARSRSGEGLGWGIQSLAQSFLRGNGTPVSTWQIPLDDCSRFKGKIGQKEEGSGKDS